MVLAHVLLPFREVRDPRPREACTSQTLRHLRDVFDITLVSNVDPRSDLPHLHQMDPLCHDFYPVPRSTVTKYSLAFYLKVLAHSLSRYPVTVLSDHSQHTVAKLR